MYFFNLNFLWDVTLPFWVIMRSGRRKVMNHIASMGIIFGRSFVGVRGISLPWVIQRREHHHDHIWISNILWRQFRGWDYALIWNMDWALSIYGSALAPWVLDWLNVSPYYYYWLAFYIKIPTSSCIGCMQLV